MQKIWFDFEILKFFYYKIRAGKISCELGMQFMSQPG